MSRGLGTWQRKIIDALPRSQSGEAGHHRGYAFYIGSPRNWTRARDTDIILADGVYDLSVVRDLLMEGVEIWDPHRHDRIEAISRAVRTLIRRGILQRLELVPILEYERAGLYGQVPSHLIHHLANGVYFDNGTRQTRFVRWRDSPAAAMPGE